MIRQNVFKPDPNIDLVLERIVDVPRELVWRAWTTPRSGTTRSESSLRSHSASPNVPPPARASARTRPRSSRRWSYSTEAGRTTWQKTPS